jgi:hypothetical protein
MFCMVEISNRKPSPAGCGMREMGTDAVALPFTSDQTVVHARRQSFFLS